MKLRYVLLLTALFAAAPLAQAQVQGAPNAIDYQGKVLDNAGIPLAPPNGDTPAPVNYTIYFRIYDSPTAGTIIWSESQVVTVSNGLFSVRIGEGNPIPVTGGGNEGNLNPRDLKGAFNSTGRYLGVTVVIPGQTPGEITPRLAFLAAPFAMVAQRAAVADNATNAALASAVSQSTGNSTFNTATFNTTTVTTENFTTANGTTLNLATLNASGTVTGANFSGNGANLTSLNASNLSSGTVPDARLSGNIAHTNVGQTFNGSNHFSGETFFDGDYVEVGQDFEVKGLATFLGPVQMPGPSCLSPSGGYFPFNGTSHDIQIFLHTSKNSQNNPAGVPYWFIGENGFGDLELGSLPLTGNTIQPYAWISRSDGSFHNSSDVRLKKDITPIGPVLDRVMQMRAVSYRFKATEETESKTIGFIAQDVEPLFPEVVSNKGDYKGMAYSELIPVAITAVQEQNKLIKENDQKKEAEIDSLRAQNKELESRLEALGKRIDKLDPKKGPR